MNKIRNGALVAAVFVTTMFVGAGVASATEPPTAGEVVGDMADEGIAGVLDIFSTNAGKVVVLAVVAFGVSWVLRLIRKGGRSAA